MDSFLDFAIRLLHAEIATLNYRNFPLVKLSVLKIMSIYYKLVLYLQKFSLFISARKAKIESCDYIVYSYRYICTCSNYLWIKIYLGTVDKLIEARFLFLYETILKRNLEISETARMLHSSFYNKFLLGWSIPAVTQLLVTFKIRSDL